ncbi:hypothetical protein EV560_103162 [Bosea sp. BK604]|nr:hypothetical protein EV560_103162 [Bosea sp. BK604]
MNAIGTGERCRRHTQASVAGLLLASIMGICAAGAVDAPVNDYPTVTRADYVFGCMAANGQTRQVLEKCACSIDVIASVLPYKDYEEAETIMSVRQRGGQNTSMFLSMPLMREKVARLKRAQIEGELRCF